MACLRAEDDPRFRAACQVVLGRASARAGDLTTAQTCLWEGIRLQRQMASWVGFGRDALDAYAEVALARGEPHLAACLLGAAAAQRDRQGIIVYPVDQADHSARFDAARAALDVDAFLAAWAEGQVMSLNDAVALALGEADNAATSGDASQAFSA
jgi:hypothetical protein